MKGKDRMKRQIRRGCFETNSSSTHAICIATNKVNEDSFPDSVNFNHGEFGWESEIYTDVESRASYLYQAICDLCYEDKVKKSEYINQIYEILGKHGIECSFDQNDKDEDGWTNGYIDHGYKTGEFVNAVMNNENRLLRYLFGESKVITGNDNSDWFFDYMDSHDFSDYDVYRKGN